MPPSPKFHCQDTAPIVLSVKLTGKGTLQPTVSSKEKLMTGTPYIVILTFFITVSPDTSAQAILFVVISVTV